MLSLPLHQKYALEALKVMQLLKKIALIPCTTPSEEITQQFKKRTEKYYSKQTKCNVLYVETKNQEMLPCLTPPPPKYQHDFQL